MSCSEDSTTDSSSRASTGSDIEVDMARSTAAVVAADAEDSRKDAAAMTLRWDFESVSPADSRQNQTRGSGLLNVDGGSCHACPSIGSSSSAVNLNFAYRPSHLRESTRIFGST